VSGNCIGASFSLTVIIKPVALVGNKLDTICSGERYTYLPDSIPAGTTFIWDIPQIFPLGAVAGTQGQTIPVSQFVQIPVNLTQQIATLRYSIIAISDNCASQPFQLQANITRPIPNISVQNRQTCSGVNVDLTPGNVPLGLSYRWDVPIRSFNSNITGMEGTLVDVPAIQQRLFNRTINRDTIDYIIYPYRDNCVGNPFTIAVTVLPLPKVSVSGNGAICQNINDTLQFNFTGNGPWQFRYNDNGFTGARGQITSNPYTLVLPPNNSGPNPRIIKVYQVQDSTCTNIEDTVVVSQRVDALPVGRIISLHGNYICNGRLDTMTAVSADDIIGWQWYKNGSRIVSGIFDSLSSNEEGVYQVVFTNRAGCSDTAVASHRLITSRSPNIKFRFDYSCINTPIRFFNQTDSLVTGPLTWNWDFGNGQTATTYNSQTSYQVPGTYHVIVSAKQQNCDAFPAVLLDSIIQIVSPIERVDLPSVSAYKNVNKPIAARSLPGYKYNWSPSIGLRRTDSVSTIFNYGINVKYGIRMTSPQGCITTDSLLVRVFNDKLVDIFVPKSFTPNGDGVNDIIYAYITGISEFRYLKIINRFGKQVFETRNVDRGWDGVYNGTPQPMSVFFWLAEGVAEDGTIVQRSGQFLLMR
jgi:gliding motility-associated-like protein